MVSLGAAAKQLKISKAAVSRAISRGELSATRRPDQSFAIDPSELVRWWDGAQHRYRVLRADQPATAPNQTSNGANGSDNAVAIQLARAEAAIEGLRELLRSRDELIEDLRGERNKLIDQVDAAHRLLTHTRSQAESPKPPEAAARAVSVPTVIVSRRSWWPFRRAG